MDRGSGKAAIIIVISFLLLVFIPSGAVAEDPPKAHVDRVIITLDQHEGWVQVAPGQTGTVKFTGNVSLEGELTEYDYVSVRLHYSINFGVSTGTSMVIFSEDEKPQPIICLVKVPPLTSSSEKIALTITGSWRFNDTYGYGDCIPDQAKIFVEPYSLFSLSTEFSYRRVEPSQSVTYLVLIQNEGNIEDNLTLDTNVDNGMIKAEILGPEWVILPERSVAGVLIEISPLDRSSTTYQVTLTARSSSVNGDDASITLYYKAEYEYAINEYVNGIIDQPPTLCCGCGAASIVIVLLLAVMLVLIRFIKR